MKILALESYYGGSHKAFIDGWMKHSRHSFDLLTLPASKWKWRMRHSAIHFADEINGKISAGQRWDCLFCSDMLNLAELLGLADESIKKLPSVIYFHENQLTYPQRFENERDYQFVMTNLTGALAAKQVWFNSAFHKDEFLDAMKKFLKRMPDKQPVGAVEQIRQKSKILYPGINPVKASQEREPGPIHILWAARWEHDKNPEVFFKALKILRQKGIDFKLSVIGQQFRQSPDVFDWGVKFFADKIANWGFQKTQRDYISVLNQADVIVSTAGHEFYGIGVLEAVSAGALPVLPNRLSYPEITDNKTEYLYDGTVKGLVGRLVELSKLFTAEQTEKPTIDIPVERYFWPTAAKKLDDQLKSFEC